MTCHAGPEQVEGSLSKGPVVIYNHMVLRILLILSLSSCMLYPTSRDLHSESRDLHFDEGNNFDSTPHSAGEHRMWSLAHTVVSGILLAGGGGVGGIIAWRRKQKARQSDNTD